MSEQDTLYNVIRDGMQHMTVYGSELKETDVILGTAHTTVQINQLSNGICWSKSENTPEIARQDGVLNISDVQDTREQLEADVQKVVRGIYFEGYNDGAVANPSWYQQTIRDGYDHIVDLLNRQAAITEREVKLRELYKFEENHRANIDATEEVNRKLNERIAELTAERDKWRARAEQVQESYLDAKDSRDNLQAAIDSMGNGQFYAMYRQACEERDALKHDREKVWCDCDCCGWQAERERVLGQLEDITAALHDKPGT